jgi:hypothetical protein
MDRVLQDRIRDVWCLVVDVGGAEVVRTRGDQRAVFFRSAADIALPSRGGLGGLSSLSTGIESNHPGTTIYHPDFREPGSRVAGQVSTSLALASSVPYIYIFSIFSNLSSCS